MFNIFKNLNVKLLIALFFIFTVTDLYPSKGKKNKKDQDEQKSPARKLPRLNGPDDKAKDEGDDDDLKRAKALSLISPLTAPGPIIIIHGFGAKDAKWYQKGGKFYEAVQASNPDHKIHSFPWNGGATEEEHQDAALKLAELIKGLGPSTIVAHSYGGRVAFLASEILSSENHDFYPIKMLFTLGTPQGPSTPQPNMTTIGQLYNLSSPKDFVAHGVSFLAHLYALATQDNKPLQAVASTERIANLTIELPANSGRPERPGYSDMPDHSDMHHPLVGKYLLSIPETVLGQTQGKLIFSSGKRPIFQK